jgi:hypothetical protein
VKDNLLDPLNPRAVSCGPSLISRILVAFV